MTDLKRTFLTNQHTHLTAKLVPFAGYSMPVQYSSMIEEHNWVRKHAGLFDISHMGIIRLEGPQAAQVLEKLCPINTKNITNHQCKYSFILNEHAGIEDDVIITKESENSFILVLNAGCKEKDIQLIQDQITDTQTQLSYFEDAPLIALQGPEAVSVFESCYQTDLSSLKFMQATFLQLNGKQAFVSRTGYTGEDGLEIALLHYPTEDDIVEIWQQLLKHTEVKPIGLGARDTLRLEAGLALYGQDLTTDITPIEASLSWAIDNTNTSFNGRNIIEEQKSEGVKRKRVGLKLTDKGMLREGYKVFTTAHEPAGIISSGGYCPTTGESIAQAYIDAAYLTHSEFYIEIRKKMVKAEKHPLRFYSAKKN